MNCEWIRKFSAHLTPTHNVGSSAEHVNDLSFAFVAPLRSQYDSDFAVVIRDGAASLAITNQCAIGVVYILQLQLSIKTCSAGHCDLLRATETNDNTLSTDKFDKISECSDLRKLSTGLSRRGGWLREEFLSALSSGKQSQHVAVSAHQLWSITKFNCDWNHLCSKVACPSY